MVRAAGVDELDCPTPEAYVAKAIELAHNRDKLAAIKAKLVAGRDSCLLFDTPRLVGALEDLYRQMWSDFKRGTLPVPDLHNLGLTYCTVGGRVECFGLNRPIVRRDRCRQLANSGPRLSSHQRDWQLTPS